MGALHDGHLTLVELARQKADVVVASIFVNPKQFGANEDFDKYPRTLNQDAKLLETKNVDALFAPSVEEIYPPEGVREQRAGVVGSTFEGASRPGHFDGVLTVVGRLFDLVQPDVAIFGAKDAQQLFMIRKLAGALYKDTEIVTAPTHREPSGLAMSSRNRYLTESQKTSATALYKALKTLRQPLSLTLEAARTLIDSTPETKLDYVAVVDPEIFRPVNDDFRGKALAIVAAKVGDTRLIDNLEIELTEPNR
jgi:pantoate--beta-alanine ligase